MATSSITKNFVISGEKQVEMFADAIEASANDRPIRVPVAARFVKRESELIEFMEKREKIMLQNLQIPVLLLRPFKSAPQKRCNGVPEKRLPFIDLRQMISDI